MNRAQIILLIVLTFGFILLGIILSQDSDSSNTFTTSKPFMARSGTSRSKARAITSETAPSMDPSPVPVSSDNELKVDLSEVPVAPPTAAPQELLPSDFETLLAVPSPEQGLALAYELLADAEGGDVSDVHRAVGVLYSRLEPADLPAALAALTLAKETALTPEQALQAELEAVRALYQGGQVDQAVRRAESVLADEDTASAAVLQIALAHADALAAAVPERAETAYRETMEHALAAEESLGAAAIDVYRLAGLRLARLYRMQKRHHDAQLVGDEVRQRTALHEERR